LEGLADVFGDIYPALTAVMLTTTRHAFSDDNDNQGFVEDNKSYLKNYYG